MRYAGFSTDIRKTEALDVVITLKKQACYQSPRCNDGKGATFHTGKGEKS